MTIPDYIKDIEDCFGHPPITDSVYNIPNTSKIRQLMEEASTINIVGDYDVDGILATLNLIRICEALGKHYTYYIPKRFTDGYGLNPNIVAGIEPGGLIITVDNGIAAHEAISIARARGDKVIILDHHLPNSIEPEADVVFDPKYSAEGWDFTEYCGAGIVYKVVQSFGIDTPELKAYAAIATVADSVPLIGDNYQIVKHGIEVLNLNPPTETLRTLVGDKKVTSSTIGYYIGPIINAPGRIYDDGGMEITLPALISGDIQQVNRMLQANVQRQGMLEEALKQEHVGEKINFFYKPDMCEGICGIVAGRLCDKNNRPSFAIVKTNTGILKGSCRSRKPNNVYDMLEECKDLLMTHGGHEEAAAFSLEESNLEAFRLKLEALAKEPDKQIEPRAIPFTTENAEDMLRHIDKYAPFGMGNREPLMVLDTIIDSVRVLKNQHLKFFIGSFEAIMWNNAIPPTSRNLRLYGRLEWNEWKGKKSARLRVLRIEKK